MTSRHRRYCCCCSLSFVLESGRSPFQRESRCLVSCIRRRLAVFARRVWSTLPCPFFFSSSSHSAVYSFTGRGMAVVLCLFRSLFFGFGVGSVGCSSFARWRNKNVHRILARLLLSLRCRRFRAKEGIRPATTEGVRAIALLRNYHRQSIILPPPLKLSAEWTSGIGESDDEDHFSIR